MAGTNKIVAASTGREWPGPPDGRLDEDGDDDGDQDD
jgi:hypothetical protein